MRNIGFSDAIPGYGSYPSSYDAAVFPTGGMAGLGYLGSAPDGYVGNATVTTSDPAPAGDLKIHAGPSASSPQTGGADKGAIVEVVTEAGLPPGWGKVGTFGSARNPQVVGYAALAYLTPIAGQGQVEPPTPGAPPAPSSPSSPVSPVTPGAPGSSKTLLYAGLAIGGVVLAGAAYYFLGD